ncbi:MAG: hypothetical protein M1836_004489 [Candelina mexicana]|nr:MAG: hypothetical protein M1836_004489 [Candelina mexicana]
MSSPSANAMQPLNPKSPSLVARSSPEAEEGTMQIFVKTVAGEIIPLSASPSTTIYTLKSLLSLRTTLPTSELRLVFAGKHLTSPSSTLSDHAIEPQATLHLALPNSRSKKIKCSYKDCRDGAQRIVGDCSFCQGHFCGRHRMLEDHKCDGLEDCKKESHERNAHKLNAERTTVIKGI